MRSRTCSTSTALAFFFSLLASAVTPASAGSISLVGALDPTDANDALLIAFSLASNAGIEMQSYGFGGSGSAAGGTNAAGAVIAAGGFDTYFSLFEGVGAAAIFLTSNDDGNCPPGDATVACRDSSLNLNLAAGSYVLAVSVFDNLSFAENFGGGTLGDGFTGLGNYFNLDILADTTPDFAVDITADGLTLVEAHRLSDLPPPTNVPEPSVLVLMAAAAIARILPRCRRGKHNRLKLPT